MSANESHLHTAAEQVSAVRARLFPLVGIALIISTALALPEGDRLQLPGFLWLGAFVLAFALVLSGGVISLDMRRLTEDESARVHRAAALKVGYIAGFGCAVSLLALSAVHTLSHLQAAHIVLTVLTAAPLISFGVQERMALKNLSAS